MDYSQYLTSYCLHTHNIGTETTAESTESQQLSCHMKEYQELLKTRYKSLELISPLEMLDCFSTQYVNLTLIREEQDNDPSVMFQQDKKCDSITLADALNVEGYQKQIVLILGGPGMGKSTLAINICKQWAECNLLQSCIAIVLLLLRDPEIQEAKTIKDLLQILDDDLRESVYKEIVKSKGEKICFILEGYDELPYSLRKTSVFPKLIEKLPRCMLVYTSRPEAYYQTSYKGSKIIRINGFNEASVNKYVSEAFEKHENGEEMARKLKTQIQNNTVIRSILNIPINVAIVCLIFFQYSTLPKTLTELYILLCLRLILRYIVTRTPNEGQVEKLQSLDNLPTGISDQFLQLCYVAYEGMENEKIIFSSQDLAEMDVPEDNLHGMGLLLIAPTTSVAGREKSYNFLHLTLQEFCAAWYISKFSAEEQVQCINECASIFHYQEGFKMVWRFYSGITKLQNKQIVSYMLPCKVVKSPFSHWKASELINIAYEASSSEVCERVGDYFNDGSSIIDLDKLESHAINYVLTQCKGLLRIKKDGFEVLIDWSQQHDIDANGSLENTAVRYLDSVHEVFVSNENTNTLISQILYSKTLKVLDIHGRGIESIKLKCLADNKNILLQNLRMCFVFNSSFFDAIGEILSNNRSFKILDFRWNLITNNTLAKLVHHLMDNNVIQQINLYSNKITADGVTHLRKLITRENSALTSIELSSNPLKDKGVNMLLQSLPSRIEHIGLCNVQMTSLSCQSLGDALHKVKSISFDQLIEFKIIKALSSEKVTVAREHLEVLNNYVKSIYSDYWEVITTNLMSTTVLEHLEVRLTDVPTSKLINAIGQNRSIKTLKLCYKMCSEKITNATNDWITELPQYVQHSKSLEKLTISGKIEGTMINSKVVINNKVHDILDSFFQLLTDSLVVNTSIKSMVYELAVAPYRGCGIGVNLSDVYKLINKLKENDTMEELTFDQVHVDMDGQLDIEDCIQQINETRNTKGIPNLKLNIISFVNY